MLNDGSDEVGREGRKDGVRRGTGGLIMKGSEVRAWRSSFGHGLMHSAHPTPLEPLAVRKPSAYSHIVSEYSNLPA